jgi:GntR family transcriptional regulator, transcriptional repressor for pyruvate dehydrogenase complex
VGDKLDLCLSHDKLYKQVADQIEGLIVGESLCPGDRLPSERQLAEQLGISRTVVREAIRLLSVRGLVEVKPGRGTYIRALSPHDAAAPIALLLKLRQCPDLLDHVYEVRHMIEIEVAGLAAERATGEDHEVMEAAIEEMAAHIDDPEEFITHDLAFHSALAAATHNDLFGVLLNAISGFWSEAALLAYQAPGAAEDSLNYHRDILRHVKARDPEKARRAMCEHVRYSQEQAKAASAR